MLASLGALEDWISGRPVWQQEALKILTKQGYLKPEDKLFEKKWERIFEPADKTSEHVLVMKKFNQNTRVLTVQDEGKKKNFEIVVSK